MKGRILIVLVLVALLLTAFVPPDSAHAASCKWHVVKRGQNLTQIARYYGVTVSAIVRANKIKNPSLIYKGQRLCIPTSGGSGGQPPPSGRCVTGCYKTYYVKRGEYLKLIGSRYGVTAACLASVNGIKNPNWIYPGQRLRIPVKCNPKPPAPKPPAPKPPPPTTGWKGLYWTNRDQAGSPKFVRHVERIDMNWGYGGPPGLGKTDDYSIRWTRQQYFEGGRYLFHVKTKDGVRVLIDGHLVIDQWHEVNHPANYHAEREVGRGPHTIRVDYFAGNGPSEVHLQIERIGGPHPGPGPVPGGPWHAEYWNNKRLEGSPVWTTSYRDIVFDWGWGSPHPGVSADFFSARYVGTFHFSDGQYRFYATVDDGVRIWVDDTLILDEWRVQSRTTFTSDPHIPEGDHKVKVEYFENTGVATLKVLWSKK